MKTESLASRSFLFLSHSPSPYCDQRVPGARVARGVMRWKPMHIGLRPPGGICCSALDWYLPTGCNSTYLGTSQSTDIPTHYSQELERRNQRTEGETPQLMWERTKGGGKTGAAMPIVSRTFAADGVRPIGLTWNPLELHPCAEAEQPHVYNLSQA